MKNMKKMITLFLLAAVLCGTAACGSNMDNNTTDTKKEESVNENTNTDDSLKEDGIVGETGEALKDGVEDLGEDIKNGAENAGDAVKDNADAAKNDSTAR